MLSLQQLRVLLAVRDHGSLTAAAAALHYGVPTVTHHLRALEAHLQAKLVESQRTGTVLTEIGESFAADVERVLARLDRAESALAARSNSGVVTLRVGTFASIGSRILPAAIARLQERAAVRVEIVEAEPTQVLRMLRDDDIHGGIIYDESISPVFNAPDLLLTSLLSEQFKVLAPAHSAWATTAEIDLTDTADLPWVFSRSDEEATDRILRRVFRSMGREPREFTRTDNLYMIHGLVEQGLCLALTTDAAADTDFNVILRPAVQDLGQRKVYLVTRRNRVPAAMVWLRDILLREAPRLAGSRRSGEGMA